MGAWLGFGGGLGLLCLLLLLLWTRSRRHSLPPGPWPVLGALLSLRGGSLLHSLLKLRERYGEVFCVHLGSQRLVVLCGYEMVKAALVDRAEDFASRPSVPLLEKTNNGHGIAFANGERWRQLRRFSLTTLRDFGMGKRSLEARIQEEIRFLLEVFRETRGAPFDPHFVLRRSVSNVICSVVFGERFAYDDGNFQVLLDLIQENFRLIDTAWVQLCNLLPGVMGFLPGPHKRVIENYEEQKRLVSRIVQQHKDTLELSAPRDYIDAFLIQMQQDRGSPGSAFSLENLVASAMDLFFAGTESTSNTLRHSLLILLKFPHVATRVQEEIDRVAGQSRAVAVADRLRMPYTDAVIHELQRFVDFSPLGVPRSVTRDTEFAGYTIPKGSLVFPMLHSVLFDPTHFQAPQRFEPRHFLREDGSFHRPAAFLPFSAGRRSCPGEGLARTELFLYLTSILQQFALSSPVAPEDLDITREYGGLGSAPRPYQLCLTPR